MRKWEHIHIMGGNRNWHSHYREYYGSRSKNEK